MVVLKASSYGEKGSVIIQKILLQILSTVDHTLLHNIKPLSLPLFSQHILVPYVATRLIAEDMGCSDRSAFKLMRESGEYGYQQFLDTDDDAEYDAVLKACVLTVRVCD